MCQTSEELAAAVEQSSGDNVHVAGLFGPSCLPYEYDRAHPEATGTGQAGMYAAASAAAAGSDPAVLPTLAEMTAAALTMLEGDEDGFFLMVEGGTIDWAGHANHLERSVYETVGFERAFEVVEAWAAAHPGTLIIVTADHETGGLKVVEPGAKGVFSTVTWSSKNHTATKVGVYAVGPGAERFADVHDNIDIHRVLRELTVPAVAGVGQ